MEEMDHETSVNVDIDGSSTPVNVYGSPVAPHGRRNDESVASTSHFAPLPLPNVNRVVSSVLHFPCERVTPEIIFLKIIDLV